MWSGCEQRTNIWRPSKKTGQRERCGTRSRFYEVKREHYDQTSHVQSIVRNRDGDNFGVRYAGEAVPGTGARRIGNRGHNGYRDGGGSDR